MRELGDGCVSILKILVVLEELPEKRAIRNFCSG